MGVLNSAKRRQNDHFFGKIASFGEVFGNLQILVRHMRATINKWGVFGIFTHIFMKHFKKCSLRLNNDVTHQTGRSLPQFLKKEIDSGLRGGIRLRVMPYAHSLLIKVQEHLILFV